MDLREKFSQDEAVLIEEAVGNGMSREVATVFIRAFQNVLGVQSDAEAHRDGAGTWTRVQAPGHGTENDPSPDFLPEGVPLDRPA